MITIEGKNYARVKDKLVEVDHLDGNGRPVLKTRTEETVRPDGRKDVTVHVDCLQIMGKTNK